MVHAASAAALRLGAATITPGEQLSGTILIGSTNSYDFSANAGDLIIARAGGDTFTPRVVIRGPGVVLASSLSQSLNNRDGEATVRATNSGTYSVSVSAYYQNGSGAYRVSLAKSPGAVTVTAGDQGGPLTNGWRHIGEIPAGDLDSWTFDAAVGDTVLVRAGGTGFTPQLRIYGPDGALQAQSESSSLNNRDGVALFRATNGGSFTVVANSYYLNGSGPYELSFVKAPGTVLVASGDQGGPFTNGWRHTGSVAVGEMDAWTFDAASGDTVLVRGGGTGFTPQLRIYGPDGVLQARNSSSSLNNRDSEASFRATNSGAFVLVADSYYLNGSGDYELTLAKTPGAVQVTSGDQGGPLTNGWRHTGEIAVGDVDAWTFDASEGESVLVRAGATGFTPQIRIYGPDGAIQAGNSSSSLNNRDGEAFFRATNGGAYTVVASSYYLNGAGAYQLTLGKSPGSMLTAPGDEGGGLTSGYRHTGVIDIGDLDQYNFAAQNGDTIVLRMGATTFTPLLRVFGPDGLLLEANSSSSLNNRDGEVEIRASTNGVYTVSVTSYYLNGSGDYSLNVAHTRAPVWLTTEGDEGGTMKGETQLLGTLAVGDLDAWAFTACQGEPIRLEAYATNFTPWIRLYGPDGSLKAANSSSSLNTRTAIVSHTPAAAGTYTVVLSPYYLNGSGPYDFRANGLTWSMRLCRPEIGATGTNRVVGVGGPAGGDFVLWRAEDFRNAGQTWSAIRTNVFDGYGVFEHQEDFSPSQPHRFYRFEVLSGAGN